jgi:hypothetical protein
MRSSALFPEQTTPKPARGRRFYAALSRQSVAIARLGRKSGGDIAYNTIEQFFARMLLLPLHRRRNATGGSGRNEVGADGTYPARAFGPLPGVQTIRP